MKRQLSFGFILSKHWSGYCMFLLAVLWFAGTALGIITAISLGDSITPLMRGAVSQPVSISGLMIGVFLPFLFAVFAVSVSELWMLPLIGGFKAFGFGFSSCCVVLSFGSSAWLIHLLLQFSNVIAVPLLYLFFLRHLWGKSSCFRRDVWIWSVLLAAVIVFDYVFISPFLGDLFI